MVRAIMPDVATSMSPMGRESGGECLAPKLGLRQLLRARWPLAVSQVGLSFLEGAVEAAILTLFARLSLRAVEIDADSIFVPGLGDRSLSFALLLLLGLIALRLSAGLLGVFLASRLQFALVRIIRNHALRAYSNSSWLPQSKLNDGEVQQLVVTVPNGISSQISGLIANYGQVSIMVAMLGYSMLTDVRLTSLLILVIVLATLTFRPLRALIKRSARRALGFQRDLSSELAQFIGIRFEVQTFGLNERASVPLHKRVDREAAQSERLGRLKGSVIPLFTTVTYLAVTFSIVILINTETGNLERTGPILLVVLRSLSYGTAIQQAASGLASLRPSLELLQSRVDQLQDERIQWGDRRLIKFESCRLQNVKFTYPSAEVAAIQEASLDISRGMRVGVVGPSGGGKSTLLRFVLGVLQPQEGKIVVNGEPLHNYDRESWSRQVGVVPQASQLLAGSIADNLRLYRDGITDEALWESLEVADLRDEVASMPQGLNTIIGPGQRALSGGQQQRLAIARAFAGRPSLVVMDEPTSSVDALSEQSISDAIGRISNEVTVVIASHRPKILEGCDLLVTVEDGRISAVGDPEVLMKSSPYLRSLPWGTEQ